MERIRQNKYENINCTKCSESFQADGVGFDFGKAISDAIRLSESGTWDSLMHLDLRFYYSVRDICQIFRHECDFHSFSNIVLRIKHVKMQLEFLLRRDRITFDMLQYSDMNSQIFNTLYELTYMGNNVEDFKIDIMHLIRNLSTGNEEDVIVAIPIRFLLGADDMGNEIPAGYEYCIRDNIYRVSDRICPSCGDVLDFQAGYRPEFIIGLAGLARVGKTVFIASLIQRLKELQNQNYIRLNITGDENDSFHVFDREVVSEYLQGNPIVKTSVEDEDSIPLIYLSINIRGRDYNFIFVDMPGEIFGDSMNGENLNYISNKRSILKGADMVWCFIEPRMINHKYHNKNVEVKDDSGQKQLSTLMSTLENIYNMKKTCCLIMTQSDLLKEDYPDLFRPDINVFNQYMLPTSTGMDLNYTEMKKHVDATKFFLNREMPSLTLTAKDIFEGFTTMSVASYGYDVSMDVLLSKKELQPSMVELPFLWTLATLGLLDTSRTITTKGFFSQNTEQEKIRNRNELFES